jgi:primosomal protein N' (replication factor Y)
MPAAVASVVLDQNLTKPLDYAVPVHLQEIIQIGMRVEIPFRASVKKATVVALKTSSTFSTLKSITSLIDETPALSPTLWKLAEWMASYYCAPMQKTLRCFLPPNAQKETQLKKKRQEFDLSAQEFFQSRPKILNDEQAKCLAKIHASLQLEQFAAHLIHGVTGSGKTEVYLQAIQKTLEQGRSAIFLVPEIALTSQTIERFRARFPDRIAIWHHKRSQGERTTAWEELKQGKTKVVIGARSAIFCPAQKVGLIIVDEEHDTSYKQSEEMPCYHGRDVAVMRAHLEGATILLGSATPSIESRYNTETGKYILHQLKTRAASAAMPTVHIVDMLREYEITGGFTHFSAPLLEALKQRLEAGEQTLLFLNRRGYHRNQICASCRSVVKCPHCDLGLTFHKSAAHLQCHLCDFTQEARTSCLTCGSREAMQFKGFGTEHVERSLNAILPDIRTLRMDRDTTKKKHDVETIYRQFLAHKADVLIGTQMIAKGFHFPAVTLVGVLSADAALHIPDFRSGETVFQLITQVAGRAGRSELPGEVILQTFLPEHPLIRLAANQDYEGFYAREIEERKLFCYPPFTRIVKITCSGPDAGETEGETLRLHAQLKKASIPEIELMAVMPAAHAKVKDLYRFQFLIKALKLSLLKHHLTALSSKLRLKIDIDPINTFF